ncbi:unnamed protein product [Peniophora sp. CBMAI 1063]|nr:unnamed protein product [Peniophora sp. CBMAI 1063]
MEQWETVSLNRTSSSASSVTSVSDSQPASPAEPNAEASSSRVEDADSRESSPSVSDTDESSAPDVTTPLATASDLKDEETSVAKHPVYYFDDGNVCFLVEDVLYCVHRYFFQRDSQWFRDLFKSPGSDLKANMGGELPSGDVFLLDGITSLAFDAFLSILYPVDFDKPAMLTAADWAVVLKLASIWDFASIRRLAIDQLDDTVNDFDRLLLGRSCGIDSWVLPALTGLCERSQPLSLDEILQMSPQDIALVTQVREDVRCPRPVEVVGSIAVRRFVWEKLGGSTNALGPTRLPSQNAAGTTSDTPSPFPSTQPLPDKARATSRPATPASTTKTASSSDTTQASTQDPSPGPSSSQGRVGGTFSAKLGADRSSSPTPASSPLTSEAQAGHPSSPPVTVAPTPAGTSST